jgi:hypothetical protein
MFPGLVGAVAVDPAVAVVGCLYRNERGVRRRCQGERSG